MNYSNTQFSHYTQLRCPDPNNKSARGEDRTEATQELAEKEGGIGGGAGSGGSMVAIVIVLIILIIVIVVVAVICCKKKKADEAKAQQPS